MIHRHTSVQPIDVDAVKNASRDNWHFILPKFGIDANFLRNKHGPCPFCGGTNRWRWDNKGGRGTGFCNQCDATGDGFHLVAKSLSLNTKQNFVEVVRKVGEILGIGHQRADQGGFRGL